MRLNRRQFLIGGAATLASAQFASAGMSKGDPSGKEVWYRRVRRWAQINLTEDDPVNFDFAFWRNYWKDNRVQGVIFNAGGDVAFYPTAVPGHQRAAFLGDRDFFGDLIRGCRAEGLIVMARLAYRGTPELMQSHPEWLCVDAVGKQQKKFCMNGGFIYQHCSSVLREIGERYQPDGYTLSGWGENYALCFCATCTRLFQEKTGHALPRQRNWDNPVYQSWLKWNEECVLALWDEHSRIARATGGPDCLWIGQKMNYPTRGIKAVADRTPFLMIDYQSRTEDGGIEEGTTSGKLFNGLMGWDKPVAQAIGLYQGARLVSSPEPEWGGFMRQSIASGVRPWLHTVSSYSEDKRRFAGAPTLTQWHARNERYLFDRKPVATVGLVWSEQNNIYFGRDYLAERVLDAWNGMSRALVKGRVPFIVVHVDHIDRDAAGLEALVLPNIGALNDAQVASIRRFVKHGGNLVATGDSSLYDHFGQPRADYALADLFGAHRTASSPPPVLPSVEAARGPNPAKDFLETLGIEYPHGPRRSTSVTQSYLRLTPALRRQTFGPHHPAEPATATDATRHPVLDGLNGTDLVIFGGELSPLQLEPTAQPLLTYIPPIPSQPPESAWLRTPKTDLPGLIVNVLPNGSRIAFMPAELDRRYSINGFADHATLLANSVRWAAGELPLAVSGPGFLDCSLYSQPGRMIVHIQNLSGHQGRPPAEEYLPVGPIKVRIRLTEGVSGERCRGLVTERSLQTRRFDNWVEVDLTSIAANEVLVFE